MLTVRVGPVGAQEFSGRAFTKYNNPLNSRNRRQAPVRNRRPTPVPLDPLVGQGLLVVGLKELAHFLGWRDNFAGDVIEHLARE